MALLGTTLDYTDKDFASLLARVTNAVHSVFPTWTDEHVANFGRILLELACNVGDILTFTQDNAAREGRWSQATQRKNLIAMAKLINFVPSSAFAAQVTAIVGLEAVPAGTVDIPAGTKFSTQEVTDPVLFQALGLIHFAAGANPPQVSVVLEHSDFADDSFVSSGLPNQSVALSRTPFLDGSAIVSAANGAYTVVSSFLDSTSTSRHCTVVVDQNDRATFTFGNGVNGAIPSGTIDIAYKVGGGKKGNVEAEKISKVIGSFTDSFGNPVRVTVTNPLKSDGGLERQTVSQIRQAAPASIRTSDRTVSREDYEINVLKPPSLGIARALMLTSNEDPGLGENHGILYIVPPGGGLPTQLMKDNALARVTVTYPKTVTFQVAVQDPPYLPIDITARVYLGPRITPAAARAAIIAALQDHFAILNADGTVNENIDFGFNYKNHDGEPANEIAWSDIENVIRDVPGVRKVSAASDGVLLNGARADVVIAAREFPILGTVVLINADTGAAL